MHIIASKGWRSPIFAYLNGTYELHDKHETDRMNSRPKQYSIVAGELYKRRIVAPMQVHKQRARNQIAKLNAH